MVYNQILPWRSTLRHAPRTLIRNQARITRSSQYHHHSFSPHLGACISSLQVRSCSPQLPSLCRPLTTSPPRRKNRNPDEVPDPIPQKEAELSEDKAKEQAQLEKQSDTVAEAKKAPEPAPPSAGDAKGSNASGTGGESAAGTGDGGRRGGRKASNEKAIQKPSIPEIYPQVMGIPIAKRPLFSGFYKAITVRDPNVTAAIQEMLKRGQPYVGAFLFKDEASDKDIIESTDDVHDVGVFAQITSAFPVAGESESLTVVLYPHRRIRISKLHPQRLQMLVHQLSKLKSHPKKVKKIIKVPPRNKATWSQVSRSQAYHLRLLTSHHMKSHPSSKTTQSA